MSLVFVVDQQQKPCRPVHPGRARHLLNRGRAAVYRRYPFTLILREGEPTEESEPVRLKIDPDSQTTGLAVVNDAIGLVVWAAELIHRGHQVTARLDQRQACHRSRRQRHTCYRPARFLNRRRHGAPTGGGNGRAHEVEPHATWAAQGPLDGRRLRGGEHGGALTCRRRHAFADHGDGPEQSAIVPNGCAGVPEEGAQGHQHGRQVPDGGHRAGCGPSE
jgi:hypothetical protein